MDHLYHGYVSHNQRVYFEAPQVSGCMVCLTGGSHIFQWIDQLVVFRITHSAMAVWYPNDAHCVFVGTFTILNRLPTFANTGRSRLSEM